MFNTEHLNGKIIMTDSKTICTLTGNQYRAAFACMAPKNDPRFYLKSILISVENKEITATNGHYCYVAPIDEVNSEKDIILEAARIPANIDEVKLSFVSEWLVLVETFNKGNPGPQFVCKVIDATYPDYKNIIPKDNEAVKEFNLFSFDAGYLAMLPRIFGKVPVRFKMAGSDKPALISTDDDTLGVLVLMPCRM